MFGLGFNLPNLSSLYNIGSAIANPNIDLVPWLDNPFNNTPQKTSTSTSSSSGYPKQVQGEVYTPYASGSAPSAGGGGGSGYSAPAYDPADLAYLNDQEARLRGQLSSADTALNNGLTQLNDSYNQEVNGANTRQSRALQDFGVKREDTTRAKDSALGRVDTNARTLADSLRRRLGMASGSSSSAYQLAAPGAVAREATKNRTGVVENFGQNFRDLDTGETRVKADFADLLKNLEAQKRTRESDFRASILDNKNKIEGSLAEVARNRALLLGGGYDQVRSAMAPHTSAIDSRQAELDGLFNRFRTPFEVKAVDTSTPNLRDYTVDRASINANNSQGADPTSPYGQFVRRSREEEPYL